MQIQVFYIVMKSEVSAPVENKALENIIHLLLILPGSCYDAGVKCSASSHCGRVKKENVTGMCSLAVFGCAKHLCSCLSADSTVMKGPNACIQDRKEQN